jgi:hypothetical protein
MPKAELLALLGPDRDSDTTISYQKKGARLVAAHEEGLTLGVFRLAKLASANLELTRIQVSKQLCLRKEIEKRDHG